MSLFGRVFKALFGAGKGTPERVSEPVEVKRESPVPGGDNGPVTYPSGWNANDRRFWDKEVPPDFRPYYTADEWDEAQDMLEQGWMFPHRPKEAVQEYRNRFYRLATINEKQFDWAAFKEWYKGNAH